MAHQLRAEYAHVCTFVLVLVRIVFPGVCITAYVVTMWIIWSLLALLIPIAAGNNFQEVEDCKAAKYGLPGFRSQRSLFPNADPVWDGMTKVGFQNAESTWLAGNFQDTGSDFVAVLFGGSIQHKEYWPEPPLMRTLALNHGISSLAVDIAGRGESCGSEALFNYTAAVSPCLTELKARPNKLVLTVIACTCSSQTWLPLCISLTAFRGDIAGPCSVCHLQLYAC